MKFLIAIILLLTSSIDAWRTGFPSNFSAEDLLATPWSALHNLLEPLHHGSLMNGSSHSLDEVSPLCNRDLLQLLDDLKDEKPWAIQMVDAFGKIPANLERGHLQWLGSYDECKNIVNSTYAVDYCLTRLGSSDELVRHIQSAVRYMPALATCLPKSCGARDIEAILNELIKTVTKNLPSWIHIPSLETLAARHSACDSVQPWETGAYITIGLIVIMIILCTFGVIVQCCHPFRLRRTIVEVTTVDDTPLLEAETVTEIPQRFPLLAQVFVSFSFATSWNTFTETRPDELPFLDGMRVATIWWVILGEAFTLGQIVYENPLDYFDNMKTFLGQLIANSSLAGDTFFILSGVLLTYTVLKKLERNEGKISWAWMYVRRWWRLTPMYAFLLLVFIFLVPHVVTGPFILLVGQDTGGNPIDSCKKYWWANMLYINNFVPSDTRQQCMDWTWFLATEMQFFVITPVLVFVLSRWPKVGIATIVSLIAGCLVTNAVIEAQYGGPIAMMQIPLSNDTSYDPNYDYVFAKPYTRASPYLLGMLLGFLFIKKPTFVFPIAKLDIVFNLGCWISSCIVANRVIFGLFDESYNSPTSTDMLARVSWQMLSRFGFSMAVCWVIFACQYNYAGPIRDILDWKVWKPLSRLTYVVYLFHPATLQLFLINQRDPFYYNSINMVNIFFAQLICVYALGFVLAILIEIPLLRLERQVLHY